jgi:hypothetical protein
VGTEILADVLRARDGNWPEVQGRHLPGLPVLHPGVEWAWTE